MNAIGIDLGGTRIKGVVVTPGGLVLHQVYRDIDHQDSASWKTSVRETVSELQGLLHQKPGLIGISAPGLPNGEGSAIAFMPGRMAGMENFRWEDYLAQPVSVLNDAVAALLAESRFGAAKMKKHVILLTLGTGVGGALLIDGKPYQGAFQKAGHLGHMVINDEGHADVTGMPGSLEECIGNCSISRRSGGRYQSTREMLLAYREGNPYAREVWLKSVRHLALGLASLTNILSPEIIVLGGGITEAGKDLFEPLEQYLDRYEWRAGGHQVEIRKAKFGDLAGAIGAACYAMNKMEDQPMN